jgi:hypothetical protein
MNTLKDKINAVINTLQTLEIKSEYNTMNKLVGCLQVLSQVSKELDNVNQNTSSEEPQITIEEVGTTSAEE